MPFTRSNGATEYENAEIGLYYGKKGIFRIIAPCLLEAPYSGTTGTWTVEHACGNNAWSEACPPVKTDAPDQHVITTNGKVPLPAVSRSGSTSGPTQIRAIYTVDAEPRAQAAPAPAVPPYETFTRNNIAFLFPEEGDDAILWSNTEMLAKASDYWKAQFESGFAESQQILTRLSKWHEHASKDVKEGLHAERIKLQDEVEDQPRAAKKARLEVRVPASTVGSTSKSSSRVGYVVIRDTPLATYKAVFSWLERGSAAFGGLALHGTTPEATAPDSVYALADLLGLDGLKKVSLANYASQLTADNVLNHRLGKKACDYPELCQVAMAAALQHLDSIKASDGPAVIQRMIIEEDDRRMREHLSGVVAEMLKAPGTASKQASTSNSVAGMKIALGDVDTDDSDSSDDSSDEDD